MNKPNEEFIPYEVEKDREQIAGIMGRVIYYNNKSGKKISEDKAKKTDSDKVSMKLEQASGSDSSEGFMNIAMPDPTDPMYNRWLEQLKNPKEDEEDKEDEN